MKKSAFFLILCMAFVSASTIQAQGFKEPATGKAVVYFVSLIKKSMTFEFFLNNKYVGILGKANYLRLECESGNQLLWASSEGKYFVAANLAPGGSYVIVVETTAGFWRNNPKLVPITSTHTDYAAAAVLIKSKPPMTTPQEKIDKMNRDMVTFIPDNLKMYESRWKQENKFPSITPEMAIPVEMLK